ncbi:MAG TPA: O-antigen ligase family protein, partial [Chloroflexota bacterium]|nr:O-antigen ligase family protein [Chloroflexota bacterium]
AAPSLRLNRLDNRLTSARIRGDCRETMRSDNVAITPSERLLRRSRSPDTTHASGLLALGIVVVVGAQAIGLYQFYDATALALAAVGLGVPAAWLLWKSPAVGLAILVFLTSGFVPAKALDLRLPVGGLDSRDLTLLGLAALLGLRSQVRGQVTIPWRWTGIALVVFLALAVLSGLYAVLIMQVAPNWALSEFRTVVYYSTFFLAALALQNRRQLVVLLVGLVLVADLTAGALIVQQFFGRDAPVLAAMSGGTWNVWTAYQGDPTLGNTQVLRIIPPGHVLTFVVSIVAFCFVLSERSGTLFRLFFAAQYAYLNLGLIFTYSRAQWIASALAVFVVFILLPGQVRTRLIVYSIGTALALAVGFGVVYSIAQEAFGASVLDAVQARASSILDPNATLGSNSLEWRIFENDRAVASIGAHPIFGVGLGAIYRAPTSLQGEDIWGIRDQYRLTRFVHDGYLYLAVKMGVIGLLSFLLFVGAVLWTGLTQRRHLTDQRLQAINLALMASVVGLLLWAITQPQFLLTESTAIIGLVTGVIASVGRPALAETPRRASTPKGAAGHSLSVAR